MAAEDGERISAFSEQDNLAPDPACESGLVAFATLLAMHRISTEPAQLRHELGHDQPITAQDLLRVAKRIDGVRAKRVIRGWNQLGRVPLPALANGLDGWFLIGRVNETEALIQRPGGGIETLTHEALESIWSGELVLVTTRESVAGAAGRFDVTWFIPQIVRYRRLTPQRH